MRQAGSMRGFPLRSMRQAFGVAFGVASSSEGMQPTSAASSTKLYSASNIPPTGSWDKVSWYGDIGVAGNEAGVLKDLASGVELKDAAGGGDRRFAQCFFGESDRRFW